MKYNTPTLPTTPAMRPANFCVQCGERLARKGWRARLSGNLCDHCAQRFGTVASARPIIIFALIGLVCFAIGRHLRPSPPPLIIQRAANSPLSDAPVDPNENPQSAKQSNGSNPNSKVAEPAADDVVYICGARTKKGTPCHRRVHAAGERCFQHKGMAAMVPLSKLVIQP